MKNKNIIRPAVITFLVLLLPFLAMQSNIEGWDWNLADYAIMGILIFGAGIFVELANLKIKNNNHKIIMMVIILLALMFIWAHLAVGIVDSWPLAGS